VFDEAAEPPPVWHLYADEKGLTRLQRADVRPLHKKVVKIGAKVIAHARSTVFQMAEVAVPLDLFRRILGLIADLRPRQVARC
jgi:hypothetical protein